MSDQRKPLVGFTAEYLPEGSIRVFAPSGKVWGICDDPDEWGIPAPPPPRSGTLGLSEESVKAMAIAHRYTMCVGPYETAVNALANSCAADVARWKAEDAAARTLVPDTLTVELPVKAMRYIAEMDWSSTFLNRARDACRAALVKAGLA